MLHIQLLETFHLRAEETTIELTSQRQRALLAYLLLHRAERQPRRQIAYALWPESGERQARTNLRRELHHLRRTLPDADDFLLIENRRLQWRGDAQFALDVAAFEEAIVQADQAQEAGDANAEQRALQSAIECYTGDLLPNGYDHWIQKERNRLAQRYVRALERLIGLLEAAHAYCAAIESAQHLLHHDPLREATYRHLMRLHARRGDRARALCVYHNCVTTLRRELGVGPDPATRKVHERLLQVDETPQPASAAAPEPSFTAEMPLIGRQVELEVLQTLWQRTTRGRSHYVVVVGEAGIGKTRLVAELIDWTARQGFAVARTRSYAAEGRLAYAPVAEWLRTDVLCARLGQLDEIWQTEITRLVPELRSERPNLPAPQPLSESWQRQRLFAALAQAVLVGAGPLLLVLDDLQWTDRETLEWLHYLLRSNPRAPLLIAGTMRPEEVDTDHPLTALRHSLRRAGQLAEIELAPLDVAETTALAASIAERELDAEETSQLYAETEGNPLFVVETVRASAGKLARRQRGTLPPQVQAVVEARLAQLSPAARQLADLAATVGRSFSFDVLLAASAMCEEDLVRALDELGQRRIIREQNEHTYDFHHDKLREVTYTTLSTANQHLLHRQVATALETIHAADLDSVSSQIADHYAHAGADEKAIAYYQRAGMVAQRICD